MPLTADHGNMDIERGKAHEPVTLFLAGDVMPGRGIDQVFARSCPPRLYEAYVSSARTYVELAERAHGPIPEPVEHTYVWGDALAELDRVDPDARIVNLETAITTSEDRRPKGVNYRMHGANVALLTVAGIDCAVLANNHVLDWGERGLLDTLKSLEHVACRTAGAGKDLASAEAAAVIDLPRGGRVLVFGFGFIDSGIPPDWAAGPEHPGVKLLPDFSNETVHAVADLVAREKRPGDLVVASVHWGSNWGYHIPRAHRRFAHALVDHAEVDVVHGHSSHHPRALEVYKGHLVLYGCGDLLNDYEGIEGYAEFRDDLVLMYFPSIDPGTGQLTRLELAPFRIRKFQLQRISIPDRDWLRRTLAREYGRFGADVSVARVGSLVVDWR